MRMIRNEFGEFVEDKPTYEELNRAFEMACKELMKLDMIAGPLDYMNAEKWKRYILEVVMNDLQ